MGRYSKEHSYDHTCKKFGRWDNTYAIAWTVDYYYKDSRLRWPRRFERITDEAGAKRFCKRWDIPWEDEEASNATG